MNIKFYYLFLSIMGVLALLILIWMICQNKTMIEKTRKAFFIAISVIIMVSAAEVFTAFFENTSAEFRIPCMIANVIGFSVTPLIPILFGLGLCDLMPLPARLLMLPGLLNPVFTLLSVRFGFIFSITPDNIYRRGPLFFIFVAAYISGLLFLMYKTGASIRYYKDQNRYVLILIYILVLFGSSLQLLAPAFHLTWFCVSFAVILYYTFYNELSQQLDVLTSLFTRRLYDHHLSEINGTRDAVVLIFDADDFKNINDQYGHKFGDVCLVKIAAHIKEAFSSIGWCYRIGGDEFCVISEQTDAGVIQKATQDFLSRIESSRNKEKRLPTVSIGWAFYDKTTADVSETVNEADQQMYLFKQKRKLARLLSTR